VLKKQYIKQQVPHLSTKETAQASASASESAWWLRCRGFQLEFQQQQQQQQQHYMRSKATIMQSRLKRLAFLCATLVALDLGASMKNEYNAFLLHC
jgi:hypothetical protein